MSEERHAFVEEFGVMFEQMGSTRMLGRVWAALMVADPPEMTAEELADYLQASRGSISQATRQLISLGVVQRVSKPGVRRDYYRVPTNAWPRAYFTKMKAFDDIFALFQRGRDAMADASPEAQTPIKEALLFYEFWQKEVEHLLDRWHEFKESQRD
ncbi:MAG TPA: MarR family transcriptional regulator [Thermomicrobiales bacterium]|jgi:DNA-binding transcriptional regulator GbsR (MarR family)|nr:MarR family transcriptional regulator [Thermomicrobiales bacterium]